MHETKHHSKNYVTRIKHQSCRIIKDGARRRTVVYNYSAYMRLFKHIYGCTMQPPRARYIRARAHGFKRGNIYNSRGGGSIPRLYTRYTAPPAAQQYRQRYIIFYNSI